MEIYHGGYTEIRKPEIIKGRFTKDFGEGFYCTALKEQAIKWSLRYPAPVVSIYTARIEGDLKIKEFKYPTHQINFCTAKALKCLTFIKSEVYSHDGQRR